MHGRFSPLTLILVAGCWVGPFTTYKVEGTVMQSHSVAPDTELWLLVEGTHAAQFTETGDNLTNSGIRDSGFGSVEVAGDPHGEGTLEVEVLYYDCDVLLPRQAGEGQLPGVEPVLIEHELDYFGSSVTRESGSPMNCFVGDVTLAPVFGIRLSALGEASWDVEVDAIVELVRAYPEKFWDGEKKGELTLTMRESSAEDLGWIDGVITPDNPSATY